MRMKFSRSMLSAYAAAIALPAAVLLLRELITVRLGDHQPLLLLFVAPAAVSALLGGLRPGLLATAVSLMLVEYFVLPPTGAWRLTAQSIELALLLLLVCVFGVVLIEALRRKQASLERALTAAEALAVEQRATHDLFSTVFHSAPAAIMVARLSDGQLVDANSAFTELWGYTRGEALGRTSNELDLWIEPAQLIQQLKANRHSDVQALQIRRKSGEARDVLVSVTMIQLEAGAALLITAQDMTVHRRAQDMERMAHYDTLTNLPNRLLLQTRLREALARVRAERRPAAVLFIDLDRFKQVNDTFGHARGDELLRLAAARLQGRLRAGDTLARVGGDEFIVLLDQIVEPSAAEAVAVDLVHHMSAPFALGGGNLVQIGASIGVNVLSPDARDVEQIVQQADEALYAAKSAGRNTVCVFAAEAARSVGFNTPLAN